MPAQTAGTEMYVYSLQRQLQREGYFGGIIIPFFGGVSSLEYSYNDIQVYGYIQDKATSDSLQKGLIPPSGLDTFEILLDKLQPDVLHFHELSGSNGITIYHMEAAEKRRIPLIITMHLVGYICATGTLLKNGQQKCSGQIKSFDCTQCSFIHQGLPSIAAVFATIASGLVYHLGISAYSQKGKLSGLLGRWEMIRRHKNKLVEIATKADFIVSINEWFANMLTLNGVPLSKITVIEQALPDVSEDFNSTAEHETSTGGQLRLVFVGRIYPIKGLHLLLEALKKISATTYILDIYGPSNDIDYLNKCKSLSDGNEKIRFCGTIPIGETVNYLKRYDLLCLPSVVTEMGPLVIQEAFAAGITVLASDVYGNSDNIKHLYNGLLFQVGNSRDLTIKIEELIMKPELLLELKKRVVSKNRFKDVCQSYITIYNAVKNNGK